MFGFAEISVYKSSATTLLLDLIIKVNIEYRCFGRKIFLLPTCTEFGGSSCFRRQRIST